MKTFDKSLLQKKIIMISDYVDPKYYYLKELDDEKKLINSISDEISSYNINFIFKEFTNHVQLEDFLKAEDPKNVVVFNWFEDVEEDSKKSFLVSELLDKLDLIYTGADSDGLKLAFDKEKTKRILSEASIRVPEYTIVNNTNHIDITNLSFPLIAKSAINHSSSNLSQENILYDMSQVENIIKILLSKGERSVMIEEFISGEEYTIPVWGNGEDANIINICRIDFLDQSINNIQTEKSKVDYLSSDFENSPYSIEKKEKSETLKKIISKDVIKSYNILGFKDYGRFELRIRNGISYIIDANANPSLSYGNSLFGSAQSRGYNYGETILKICEFALRRKNNER